MIDQRPKKSVAKQYGIRRQTLQDYVKRASAGDGVEKCHIGWPITPTNDQEAELSHVLISRPMTNKMFGLSPKVVRELVFSYSEIKPSSERKEKTT